MSHECTWGEDEIESVSIWIQSGVVIAYSSGGNGGIMVSKADTTLGHVEIPVPVRSLKSSIMGPVSSWMGAPHSSAIGCCSRAVRGEALNCWVYTNTLANKQHLAEFNYCLLYTSPSPRDS